MALVTGIVKYTGSSVVSAAVGAVNDGALDTASVVVVPLVSTETVYAEVPVGNVWSYALSERYRSPSADTEPGVKSEKVSVTPPAPGVVEVAAAVGVTVGVVVGEVSVTCEAVPNAALLTVIVGEIVVVLLEFVTSSRATV
jgi:hypothetical protein